MDQQTKNAIAYVRSDLKLLARKICELDNSGIGGISEQEVEDLISEAPINNNTQVAINGLQQQIDSIEGGSSTIQYNNTVGF